MLLEQLGLIDNPFKVAVSEREPAESFGSVYVDPFDGAAEPLLEWLGQPRSQVVLADYGMGKTATSLALTYTLRGAYTQGPTLHVRYTPMVSTVAADPEAWAQHCFTGLVRELTIDLLVQFFERFGAWGGSGRTMTEAEQQALTRQLRAAPQSLRRAISDLSNGRVRRERLWGNLRITVRPEVLSDEWLSMLRDQVTPAFAEPPVACSLDEAVADARTLGFDAIFVALDAADDATQDPGVIVQLLRPLLERLPEWHGKQLFLKAFLPSVVDKKLIAEYKDDFNRLTPPVEVATIAPISPLQLSAILAARLRAVAAHSGSISSLDWLRGPDIRGSIQDALTERAGGSPRRAIELADELLRFHEANGFADQGRLTLTNAEWQQFLAETAAPPPH